MKKIVGMFIVLSLLTVSFAFASDKGTPKEAEAMVKKAVAYLKANGKDKAFAEFDNPKGTFKDRDLYVTVYDMNGKCLAHGANLKMIGKDLIDLTDADGKPFIKERVETAKTKGGGVQYFKFSNPVTKKIEDKVMYFEKIDDVIVACGAYR